MATSKRQDTTARNSAVWVPTAGQPGREPMTDTGKADPSDEGEPVSFSVVIVTHEREELCRRAHESVARAARRHDGGVEVLLVNSSARPLFDREPDKLIEVHVPRRGGSAAKRNIGIERANHEWVVFVDDDCRISEDALGRLAREIAERTDAAALYPITEFDGTAAFPLRCCEQTHFTHHFEASRYDAEREWGPCTLAAVSRNALLEIGGFDESFTSGAGGEDVDLGLRLAERGYAQYGIPEVLVKHDARTWNSLEANLRRFFHYGLGETDLQRAHPNRTHLKLNALGTETALALAMVPAFVLAGRSLLWPLAVTLFALLLLACYAVYNRRAYGKSLLEGAVLRLYDYAFEAGNLYNSVRAGAVSAPFFRHRSGTNTQSPFPFGREEFVYPDEVPTLIALALAATLTYALVVGS